LVSGVPNVVLLFKVESMKSIPASVAIIGVAALLAAAISAPATALAADWAPSAPRTVFPHAYAAVTEAERGPVILASSETSDPYRYSRERLNWGYGGAKVEHHFGMHPDDPERPRHRRYYPYVYGGYAFSAPYFVNRGDYDRPEYDKVPYGKAQKYRWGREHKKQDLWDNGRW
jgi:hypothetical protein